MILPMNPEKQSMRDKKTIQELVSDISHQVKTPVANIRMFAGILKEHELPEEQRKQFLDTMEGQIGKLDFSDAVVDQNVQAGNRDLCFASGTGTSKADAGPCDQPDMGSGREKEY